ncbi:hypothetical protein DS2_00140 [Catenovulum agarivorans DS-2]|uniref:Uncharacterized protein n=1 Tax=Catenovulum agarivorans DS-2 TaxID=1328313 RepID=W7QJN9_9ALTE|nr:hypothetical protein [Catenovulum agarivorans]EWH12086.1 hypothetical protein DS2_00140 [Catenovulum agarivorans DS-2]
MKTRFFKASLVGLSLAVLANVAQANEKTLPPSQQLTDSSVFMQHKEKYTKCVLEKAESFSQVTDIDTAFKYAPIACRRDLLQIKKMLIGGPYKIDVIDQLVDSVQEGVEIDMVNHIFNNKIKAARH